MKIKEHVPINKAAAIVTSKGFEYTPERKRREFFSPYPIPIGAKIYRHEIDHTGVRIGRLIALGKSKENPKKWVVRCDCGNYALRSSKTFKNFGKTPNSQHMCAECGQIEQNIQSHKIDVFMKKLDKKRKKL